MVVTLTKVDRHQAHEQQAVAQQPNLERQQIENDPHRVEQKHERHPRRLPHTHLIERPRVFYPLLSLPSEV